jgi:hypothetical protein
MPVRSERDAKHHLAAVRLDRIQVRHPDTEQPAAQAVVHTGDKGLLVLALFGAGDDIRPPLQNRSDEGRNVFRQILEVSRVEDENIATGHVAGRAQRVGNPALAAVAHDRQEGVLASQLTEYPISPVPRAIVDDDHLEGKSGGTEGLGATLEELREVFRLVLGRDEYAHIQRLDRSDGHTRFRIRAGRMPSWSRYLATVRRAIWIPCSWKR